MTRGLVETVGVGQSEITVAGMVDTFVYLILARTGDQLQGIKKGILEIADVIAVNKADDREAESRAAAAELAGALRLVHRGDHACVPPVLTCSALTGDGVAQVWTSISEHRSVAAIASIQVRPTLLNASCAVSDQPEVCECARSVSDFGFFGSKSDTSCVQISRAARSLAPP